MGLSWWLCDRRNFGLRDLVEFYKRIKEISLELVINVSMVDDFTIFWAQEVVPFGRWIRWAILIFAFASQIPRSMRCTWFRPRHR